MTRPSIDRSQPGLGFGLGLRPDHYETILAEHPAIDWFEVLSENYMVDGGKPLDYLDRIRADYPVVMHGVSLSIGSRDPLDEEYLAALKVLAERIEPEWVSDHLCWTGLGGVNMHDLLPLPYTEEALAHVVKRLVRVQELLDRPFLMENVSSYVSYRDSEMTEWEFFTEVCERADCLMLLDVNNIYVSAFNHEFDPQDYLAGVPAKRVRQYHLAGHLNCESHIIDTHDHPVIDPVWQLYRDAVRRFGSSVASMIERDANIPPLDELIGELDQARRITAEVLAEDAA